MLYYNKIKLSERTDVGKSNNSKECMICHYWYFNHWLNFQNSVCNGGHDFLMLYLNISNITIITVKRIHHWIIHNISKSDAINLLENPMLDDLGYV